MIELARRKARSAGRPGAFLVGDMGAAVPGRLVRPRDDRLWPAQRAGSADGDRRNAARAEAGGRVMSLDFNRPANRAGSGGLPRVPDRRRRRARLDAAPRSRYLSLHPGVAAQLSRRRGGRATDDAPRAFAASRHYRVLGGLMAIHRCAIPEQAEHESDTSKWSGEGTFTQVLLDRLGADRAIAFIRVEDAPASRSEADYNFISNEIFVGFAERSNAWSAIKRFGLLPGIAHRPRQGDDDRRAGGGAHATARTSARPTTRTRDAAVPAGGAHRAAVSDARLQAGRTGADLRGGHRAAAVKRPRSRSRSSRGSPAFGRRSASGTSSSEP